MTAEDKLAKREASDIQRETERHEYYQPAVDVSELSNQVVLKYDMPGVDKNNIEITVEKGTLSVIGNVSREDLGTPVYQETRVGNYRRDFTLPDDVDADNISAEMTNGVLIIKIDKPEKAKPKTIAISS